MSEGGSRVSGSEAVLGIDNCDFIALRIMLPPSNSVGRKRVMSFRLTNDSIIERKRCWNRYDRGKESGEK